MREFKVIQMNAAGTGLEEEFVMFRDFETADQWARHKNSKRPGTVIDIEPTNFTVSEHKYEF